MSVCVCLWGGGGGGWEAEFPHSTAVFDFETQ